MKKKILSCLLALVSVAGLMTGCKGDEMTGPAVENLDTTEGAQGEKGDGTKETMGRFIETEVTFPSEAEQIYCMGERADGTVSVITLDLNGQYQLLTSTDMGETWQSTATELSDAYITSGGVTPDGDTIVTGYFMEGQSNVQKIASDGSVSEITLNIPEGQEPDLSRIYQAGVDASGNVFVRDLGGHIYQADIETGACTQIEDTGSSGGYFGVAGDKLLCVTENGILIYNTAKGESEPQNAVLDDIIKQDSSFARQDTDRGYPLIFSDGTEEGSIVYANHQGIFYYRNGGSMAEQLVNGELNSLGNSSATFYEIIMLDEEHFLVHLSDGSKEKICKYSYDSSAAATPENELTIYALKDSMLLRTAVALYQTQNQDTFVNVEIGMEGADGITAEDAVSALNTKILAGDVPDILVLDGLPVNSYIEKGILADISGFVEQMEQTDGLFSNISSCYKTDGVYYQLPVCFFPIMANGDEEALQAQKDMMKFADYVSNLAQSGEQKILDNKNAYTILKTLFWVDAPNWLTQDGRLEEEQLKKWLEAAKKIYDINGSANEEASAIDEFENYLLGNMMSTGVMLGDAKVSYGSVVDIVGYVDLLAAEEQTGYGYDVFNSDRGNVFVPYLSMGIAEASDAGEEAEKFLSILYGKECAGPDSGFPVNRASYQALCEESLEKYGADSLLSIGGSTADGREFGYTMNQFDEKSQERITSILESLTVPTVSDITVQNIVRNAAKEYLLGNSSEEETLAAVKQKLTLYLSE